MRSFTPKEFYEVFLLKESIPEELENIRKNPTDSLSLGFLCTRYRQLAVLEWHLHHDAQKFKEYIKTSVEYEKRSIELIIIKRGHVKTYANSLVNILDAMSAGDGAFMKDFIALIDDHFEYGTKPSAHPADWLYRCLVVLALERYTDQFAFFLEKLKKGYSTKKYGKLYPLALMIEAIWNKDEVTFNEQGSLFAEGYKKLTRSIFPDDEDQFLALWALGICNLAAMKGMKVTVDHQYIPRALIG